MFCRLFSFRFRLERSCYVVTFHTLIHTPVLMAIVVDLPGQPVKVYPVLGNRWKLLERSYCRKQQRESAH